MANVNTPLPPAWKTVAATAVAASSGAVATEVTLFSCVVPGGSMGPNGQLRWDVDFSVTNNANNKQFRIRFGGVLFYDITAANEGVRYSYFQGLQNRNSQSSQMSKNMASQGTAGPRVTAAIDTSVDQTFSVTITKTVAGDTATVERVLVESLYGA